MSWKVISEKTVRFTEIELEEKIVLAIRREINPSLVMRYFEKYENGFELPPLDVQKDTYVLINGYHRYQALKNLKREQVKVKIWDVNDEDLIYLAYRLNDEQGQAVDSLSRDMLISRARRVDKKSLKEIGQIFGITESRVSQILTKIEMAGRNITPAFLSNLDAKEIKVDLREKISKRDVLKKIEEGIPQSEIAKEFKITEGRVSQIKKEDADWHGNAAVTFTLQNIRIKRLINTVLLNGLFPSGFIQFWSDHIDIRNFRDEVKVIARYSTGFFVDYKVNQEGFEGYVKKEMFEGIDRLSIDCIDVAFIEEKPFNQTVLLKPSTRWEDSGGLMTFKTKNIKPQDDRLPYFSFEELNSDVDIKVVNEDFPSHEKGTLNLEVKDDKLFLDFNCRHGYHCTQPIKINAYAEGKKGDVKAHCDLEVLDTILHKHRGLIYGDFWMHFWRDRENVAISQSFTDNHMLVFL